MRYQHTNTSHNRSSGFSSVAEIAGGMGLRSPQPQQLALDFAPAQVRSHGLRDAHTYPQVARGQGASFRVPASQAWGYPSLELRAGNSFHHPRRWILTSKPPLRPQKSPLTPAQGLKV